MLGLRLGVVFVEQLMSDFNVARETLGHFQVALIALIFGVGQQCQQLSHMSSAVE